jgi:hypothetical protein
VRVPAIGCHPVYPYFTPCHAACGDNLAATFGPGPIGFHSRAAGCWGTHVFVRQGPSGLAWTRGLLWGKGQTRFVVIRPLLTGFLRPLVEGWVQTLSRLLARYEAFLVVSLQRFEQ